MVLVAGCSGGNPIVSTTVGATSEPSPSLTGSASDQPTIVDAIVEWAVMAGPRTDGLTILAGSKEDLYYEAFGDEGVGKVLVHSMSDGTKRVLAMPSDYLVQQALEVDDAVAFALTSETDLGLFEVRLWRDGASTSELLWAADAAHPDFSEIGVAGTSVFLVAVNGSANCLMELPIPEVGAKAEATQVACSDEGDYFWWLKSSGVGGFSFLADSDTRNCGEFRLVSSAGDVSDPTFDTGCVSRGVSNGEIAVWSTAPVAGTDGNIDWFHVKQYASVGDDRYSLGDSAAGSPTICMGAVYWKKEPDSSGPGEIRRWTPGRDIEVIFRSPVRSNGWDRYLLSSPECLETAIGFMRIDTTNAYAIDFVTSPSLGWIDSA